ncbi:hypothetical protein ACOZB2_28465, partial [Pantoea endophytica]
PHHEESTGFSAICKERVIRFFIRQMDVRKTSKPLRRGEHPAEHQESHDPVYTAARPLRAGGCLTLVTSPSWMFPGR